MSGFRQDRGLRHLPFFEVIAAEPEGSARAASAKAGLLVLRLIDHWILAGSALVEPESRSVVSARQAILAMPPNDPARAALLTIVNAMQALRAVRLEPVLPRLAAYGMLLRHEPWAAALAADVECTVTRLNDLIPPPPADGPVREGSRSYG